MNLFKCFCFEIGKFLVIKEVRFYFHMYSTLTNNDSNSISQRTIQLSHQTKVMPSIRTIHMMFGTNNFTNRRSAPFTHKFSGWFSYTKLIIMKKKKTLPISSFYGLSKHYKRNKKD